MLKRLYTLFIIIALTVSSTIKAEGTVYPTLTTKGGTYQLVTSTDDIVDGGVYLIADNNSKKIYVMSTIEGNDTRFSSVTKDGDYSSGPISSLSFSTVNSTNMPYEYIFEKVTNGWYIKNKDNSYVSSGRTTSGASPSTVLVPSKDKSSLFTIVQSESPGKSFAWRIINEYSSSVESNFDGESGYFTFWDAKGKTAKYICLYKKNTSSSLIPFTMSSVGYATLYYGEKDITLPEGLTASTYTLKKTQDATYLTPSHTYYAGDKIPAETAVVVKGNPGEYTLTLSDKDNNLTKYSNVLKGCDVETTLPGDASKYFYKLTLNSDGDPNSIGFYWANDNGTAFTTLAHKAYLAIEKSAAAKRIVTFLDSNEQNTTGLVDIKVNAKADAVYELSGKHVSASHKGIQIRKGKKYLMK